MGTEEAILYSYDLATLPSILPAFASKKDLILCDEVRRGGVVCVCLCVRARARGGQLWLQPGRRPPSLQPFCGGAAAGGLRLYGPASQPRPGALVLPCAPASRSPTWPSL